MSKLVDKTQHDVVKIFLHFVASVGDVERTALACDLDPEIVRQLALSEGWAEKIKLLSLTSKSSGLQAGEFERMQNRAMAWVQGHRLRQVLDRVICKLHEMPESELIDEITTKDKEGSKRMSARLFTDLATSLETVNGLCFAALGDTVPERKPQSAGGAHTAAELHASLIAALNGPGAKAKPSDALIVEASQVIDSAPTTPSGQPVSGHTTNGTQPVVVSTNEATSERKALPPVPLAQS